MMTRSAMQKELESEVIENRYEGLSCCCSSTRTRSRSVGGRKTKVCWRRLKCCERLGVEVYETDRGGQVTYHGLGQIVGYPIISLSPDREDVHKYVRDIEEVLIRTMADFGIEAFRIEGLTGVHTAEGKVAAIGVHIKRWVTTHGFALNVNTDLSYYNWIIACEGEPVTSMERLLGREVDMVEVENKIVRHFKAVFDANSACLQDAAHTGNAGVSPAMSMKCECGRIGFIAANADRRPLTQADAASSESCRFY